MLCCCLCFLSKGLAQVFPINVNTQIIPPYSLYLSDYASPGLDKIFVNVLLQDLNEIDYQVRLKLKIEGVGIRITSNDAAFPEPLLLTGGVPEIFDGITLAPYFDIQNLIFEGLSKSEYLRTKRLPEGIYQVCFEVWDYNRDVKVSNSGCVTAWMMLSEPPLLTFPENNSVVEVQDPQALLFQWTPRHTGSPNAAFNVNYNFRLVEVWPEDRDPNDAMLSTLPLYETNTMQPLLLYSPAEPLLVPGRTYAYQVTVADNDGLDLFRNNGQSEVFRFKYGYECPVVENLEILSVQRETAVVKWASNTIVNSSKVDFRPEGSDFWYDKEIETDRILLSQLNPDTHYEVRVTNTCGLYESTPSGIFRFSTSADASYMFRCESIEDEFYWIEDPVDILKEGDQILAGDFEVLLTEVRREIDGTFSGSGIVPVPYFSLARINVEFEEAYINKDRKLTNGVLTTRWKDQNFLVDPQPSDPIDVQPPATSPGDSIPDIPVPPEDLEPVVVPPGMPDSTDTVGILPPETGPLGDSTGNAQAPTSPVDSSAFVTPVGNQNPAIPPGAAATGNTPNPDADALSLGAIKFYLNNNPGEGEEVADGKCLFQDIDVDVKMPFKTPWGDQIEIELGSLQGSLIRSCDEGIPFSAELSLSEGEIRKISAGRFQLEINELTLFADREQFEGSIKTTISLTEDVTIDPIFKIEKTELGSVEMSFKFNGFDWETNLNASEVRDVPVLLSLAGENEQAGTLTFENSSLSASLYLTDTRYQMTGGALNIISLSSQIEYSEGSFQMLNGAIDGYFEIDKFIKGLLPFKVDLMDQSSAIGIEDAELQAFGLQFSETVLSAKVSSTLRLQEISGVAELSSNLFKSDLALNEFRWTDGRLDVLDISGSMEYEGISVEVESSKLSNNLLTIDASAHTEFRDIAVLAKVDSMTIDEAGNIYFGDLDLDFTGTISIGPLQLALSTTPEQQHQKAELTGFKVYSGVASLDWKQESISENDIALGNVAYNFQKHKRRDEYSFVEVNWTGKDVKFGDWKGLQLSVDSLGLRLGDGTEVLGENPRVTASLRALGSLQSKVDFGGLVTIMPGLEARMGISLDGDERFVTWESMENLKIESTIFQGLDLTDQGSWTIDDDGLVSINIQSEETYSYSIADIQYTVSNLEVSGSFNIEDPMGTLQIDIGQATLAVEGMKGMEGALQVSLQLDELGKVNATIDEGSSIKVLGFSFEEMNLDMKFGDSFQLLSASGSANIQHDDLEGQLALSRFEWDPSGLKTFEAEGNVSYNGFGIEIFSSSLSESGLQFSGKLNMRIQQDGMWLEVEDFLVDEEGKLSVGRIAGEIDQDPLLLQFSAGFEDRRFFGTFNADLKSIGLEGKVDFGKHKNFHFAYLELTSGTNIPIAATGLRFTQLGGRAGYNYSLSFNQNAHLPSGQPEEGVYVLGLTLGLADVTGFVELTGSPILQLGKNPMARLEGEISIPKSTPTFHASGFLDYDFTTEKLSGNLESTLNLPPESGALFRSGSGIDFEYDGKNYQVRSNSLSGELFREVQFQGIIDLKGSTQKAGSMSGLLIGMASYEWSFTDERQVFGADITSSLNAGFNFQGKVDLVQNRLHANLDLDTYVNGSLEVVYGLVDAELNFAGSCAATLKPITTGHRLSGDLDLTINLQSYEKSLQIPISRDF